MSNFGMQLEISGKDTLTPVLKTTTDGYQKFEKAAVESTNAAAAAAERSSRSVTALATRTQKMADISGSAAADVARAASVSTAAIRSSIDIADQYGAALEAAQGAGRDYAHAMSEAASMSAAAAQRSAVAQETSSNRISRAFDSMRTRVRTVAGDMARSMNEAKNAIGAEKYEAATERISRASEAMQGRAVRAFKLLAAGVAGLVVTASIVGASFEQAMARVGSTVGATDAQLATMKAEAKRWGNTTSFSAKSVAEAMLVAGDSIGNAAETIAATGPIVQLSGARNMALAESADLVTQAMDAFGLSGAEAGRIVNVLAASAGVDTASLRAGLSSVAAAAGNVGLSIEQTVAMLALLDKGGQKATKSAAGLQGIFSALLSPGDNLKALLGGMTVQSDGLVAVFQRLASQGQAALSTAFDARQLQVILTLAKAGPQAFEDMTNSLTGTNAAAEMFARNQDTVQAKFLMIKNVITGTMIGAFEAFAGVGGSTLDQVRAKLQQYQGTIIAAAARARDWVVAHKDQIASLIELAVKIAPVILGLGLLLKSTNLMIDAVKTGQAAWTLWRVAFAASVPIINAVSTALGGAAIASASLAGPIGIAIVAIVGIVAAMAAFRRESDLMAAGVPQSIGAIADEMAATEMRAMKMRDTMEREWGSVTVAPVAFQAQLRETEARIEQLRTAHTKMASDAAADYERMKAAAVAGMPRLSEFSHAAQKDTGANNPPAEDVEVKIIPTLAEALFTSAYGAIYASWDDMYQQQVDAGKTYTQEWLTARMAQIERAYLAEATGADVTAQQVAAARIQRDTDTAAAMKQNAEGVVTHERDLRIASLAEQAGTSATYTQQWLDARTALIQENYAAELAANDMTATQIVERRLAMEQQIQETQMAFQEAYYQKWLQDHDLMVAGMAGFGAAYDAAVNMMIQGEMNLHKIRTALWASFKRGFLTTIADMFKQYIANQIKSMIITGASTEAFRRAEQFSQARAGAREAYKSQAGIPIIGPALGVAAMTQAFALLMAFHSGGMVGRMDSAQSGNERIARVLVGEYIVQPSSVQSVGASTLDYINRTGRLPETGTQPVVLQMNVQGGQIDTRALEEFAADNLVPVLEDAIRDGRFNIGGKKGKYS